ncbi:hypothetical protein [Flavobacterium ustbae]|uniref:hypothetical protein n=1 Tax=Flavobacterium ustbae TaxID=2488790 RepID=UPI000F77E927|nr:hypothetical protein [Flavobacterium ustbae]
MDTSRKIMLKTSVIPEGKADKELVHLNFMSMGEVPDSESYGVEDEADKAKLNKLFQYLKSVDETFFKWLEADANNAILFANEPLKAIKTAIPNFDESLLTSINKNIFK